LENELQSLQAQVNQTEAAAKARQAQAREALSKLQDQQASLDANIQAQTNKLADLSQQMAAQQAALQHAQAARGQSEQSLADVNGKLAVANASRAALHDVTAERQVAENGLGDAQTRLARANADLTAQQGKITDAQAILANLQQATAVVSARRQEQERQQADLADNVTKLRSQIDVLGKQRAILVSDDAALAQCHAFVQPGAVPLGVGAAAVTPALASIDQSATRPPSTTSDSAATAPPQAAAQALPNSGVPASADVPVATTPHRTQ
jgi:chromosome segregation ATPase